MNDFVKKPAATPLAPDSTVARTESLAPAKSQKLAGSTVPPESVIPLSEAVPLESANPSSSGFDKGDMIVPEHEHNPKPPRISDMPAQNVPGTEIKHGGSQEEIQSPVQLRQSPAVVYDEQTSDIDSGGTAINRRIAGLILSEEVDGNVSRPVIVAEHTHKSTVSKTTDKR